jgi:hypothetical protein
MKAKTMIVVFVLLFLSLSVFYSCRFVYGKTVHCPARAGEVIREEQVAGAAEKDKLVEEEVDEKGNKVELWCIDGTWFGKRYAPKGGTAVWVGKCAFPGGRNGQDKCSPDANKNGKPDEWEKISWTNVEPPPNGTHDWDYEYTAKGPNKGKLLIQKTEGHWSAPYQKPDGKWYRKYVTDKVVDSDTIDAPAKFEDLKFKGVPIDPPDPNGTEGAAAPIFEFSMLQTGPTWKYGLTIPILAGTGTSDDPYVGLPTSIVSGDTLTIAGAAITNAYVGGHASLPEFGGWAVSGQGACFVTYVATSNATLSPGEIADGFTLQSCPNAPSGETGYVAYGDGLNSAGMTTGPVYAVPVGGYSVLVAKTKADLPASYIGVASTILVATVAATVCVKRVKRRKEKQ